MSTGGKNDTLALPILPHAISSRLLAGSLKGSAIWHQSIDRLLLRLPHRKNSFLRYRKQIDRCTEASVQVVIPECLAESGKCRLAGAVTWCDVFNFIGVMNGGHDFLDLRVTCRHKVKHPSKQVD